MIKKIIIIIEKLFNLRENSYRGLDEGVPQNILFTVL